MRWIVLAVLAWGCASSRGKGNPVAAFGPAGVTDAAARPLRHALLVGIDQFQDSRFTALRYAAADAQAFGRALADFDDVRILVKPEQTTRAQILAELGSLEGRVRSSSDTVLLYFSTHGSLGQEPGGELKRYLVAADTRMDLVSETGISIDALVRKADVFRSRRNLLVLAACHSGKGKSQLPDDLSRALAANKAGTPPPLEQVSEAVIVLTAAAFRETAREDDALGHDVYTHFLLRALDEGDRDGDGAVTASEAHDYARERTYSHTGGAQRPTSESSVLGRDPIVLRGQPTRVGRPVVYSYAPSAEGVAVVVNGVEKGTLPGGIALQPGSYRLRLANARDGRVLYEGGIDVNPGQYVDLSTLVPRAPHAAGELALGVLVPLSPAARAVLPAMPLAAARVAVERFPLQWLRAELGAGYLSGSADDTSFPGARVPYRTQGGLLSLGLVADVAVPTAPSLSFGAGASAGLLLLARDAQGNLTAHQSLRATTASALVELNVTVNERLRVGARVEAMGILGSIGGRSGHLALVPTANARFAF